mmetsp:Transcript_12454/g.44005  ORF Transcript_12454/g.44005 Transcript_12454/m.44005 type:complete len:252 (+) Transcript_12454:4876-5631(+)
MRRPRPRRRQRRSNALLRSRPSPPCAGRCPRTAPSSSLARSPRPRARACPPKQSRMPKSSCRSWRRRRAKRPPEKRRSSARFGRKRRSRSARPSSRRKNNPLLRRSRDSMPHRRQSLGRRQRKKPPHPMRPRNFRLRLPPATLQCLRRLRRQWRLHWPPATPQCSGRPWWPRRPLVWTSRSSLPQSARSSSFKKRSANRLNVRRPGRRPRTPSPRRSRATEPTLSTRRSMRRRPPVWICWSWNPHWTGWRS